MRPPKHLAILPTLVAILGCFALSHRTDAQAVPWTPQSPDTGLWKFAKGTFDASDTIQFLIDRLPRAAAVPTAEAPVGGVIDLPGGTFWITKPLRLPSGVTLRGEGAGTVIRCTAPPASCAIELDSLASHGSNIAAHVERLCIYTDQSRGIAIGPRTTGAVEDLVLRDLILNTAGVAIDLYPPKDKNPVYFPLIENVRCAQLGSGAIRLRASIASVRALKLTGSPRVDPQTKQPRFTAPAAPDDALCVFDGHGTISDCQFEGSYPTAMAQVRGDWTMQGNWFETHALDFPHVTFTDARVRADELFFFHDRAKLVLRNSTVRVSDRVDYRDDPKALDVDEKSKLLVQGSELRGATTQPAR